MSEKDIRFDNIVKALYPPFLYLIMMIAVEAGADIYLLIKQTDSVNASMGSFMSSYQFFENLDKRLENYTYIITLIAASMAVIVFGILFIRDCSVNQDFLTAYRWKNVKRKDFFLSVGIGFFSGTGLSRLVYLLPLDDVIGSYEKVSSQLLKGGIGIQLVSLGIVVPIAEELIYRGLVFLRMKKLMEVWTAAVFASVMFGLFHFNLLQGVYTFMLSMVLITVFLKYRSIIPCIIIHSMANITAVLSEYYQISEAVNTGMVMYLLVMLLELFLMGALLYDVIEG